MSSAISGFVLGNSFDVKQMDKLDTIGSRSCLLNIASDAVALSDENQKIASQYLIITKYSLVLFTINTIATAALLTFAGFFGTLVLSTSCIIGAASVISLNISTLIVTAYCLVKYSAHVKRGENFKSLAMAANAQAAKLNVWNGKGLISGLFAALFSFGNPTTKIVSQSSSSNSQPMTFSVSWPSRK